MNKKDWRQIIINSRAKDLAWKDLDKHDQRIYLSEAEKEVNKEELFMCPSIKKKKANCSTCQGTGEVHTVCDQGHYGSTSKCSDCE